MIERKYQIREYGSSFELRYGLGQTLKPGDRITDSDRKIGLVSNGNLLTNKLELKYRDYKPIIIHDGQENEIYRIELPGKSGILLFDGMVDRRIVGEVVEKSLKRGCDRRDKLHVSTVGQIEKVGWFVLWAPLPKEDNLLHVRIVPCSSLYMMNPTIDEINSLNSVFHKAA